MLFGTVLDLWDFWWVLVIVTFGLSGLTVYLKPKESARLRRIEAKLDLLIKHAGLTYDPYANLPLVVQEAIRRGEKVTAIKLYRDATGVDLAEAKEAVEDLMAASRKA